MCLGSYTTLETSDEGGRLELEDPATQLVRESTSDPAHPGDPAHHALRRLLQSRHDVCVLQNLGKTSTTRGLLTRRVPWFPVDRPSIAEGNERMSRGVRQEDGMQADRLLVFFTSTGLVDGGCSFFHLNAIQDRLVGFRVELFVFETLEGEL